MSKDRILQSLWSVLLGVMLCAGSLAGAVTALELLSAGQVTSLVIWCLVWAVALAVLCPLRFGSLLWLLLPLGMAYFWFHGSLEQSVERLVFEVSSVWSSAYGWEPLYWSDHPTAGSMMGALRCLALVLLLPLSWAVNRRGSAWLAIMLSAAPLASTLLLTDTVPGSFFLVMYLMALLILLISQGTRRRDASQGNRLCLMASAPALAMLGLILLLNPRGEYDKQHLAVKLENAVIDLASRLADQNFFLPEDGVLDIPPLGNIPNHMNLESVGPKTPQNQQVMTVHSTYTGTVYLRGASYAEYDGQSWSDGRQDGDRDQWPAFDTSTAETLVVSTNSAHDVLYLPYYSSPLRVMEAGRVENPENLTAYQVHFKPLSLARIEPEQDFRVDKLYTHLPDSSRSWAVRTAEDILSGPVDTMDSQSVYAAAQAICSFVSNSATYSLDTSRMPKGERDFARWFIEDSDTGYCIHFASAATVLLRGAGISARYVTGYAVRTVAGQTVDVRLSDAHAWVEYYVPGAGWMVLEPTPSSQSPEDPFGPDHPIGPDDPTEPGGGDVTIGPDDPTAPQDSTGPQITAPQPLTTPASGDTEDPGLPPVIEPGIGETTPGGNTHPGDVPGDVPGGTTVPGAETTPESQDDPANAPPEDRTSWAWLLWILIPAGVAGLIWLQWKLRLQLRHSRMRSRRGNARVLAYWREAELFARAQKQTPPRELLDLAHKARFSQHTLTPEEIAPFRSYLSQSQEQLRKHPLHRQAIYRLIYALY